MIVKKDYTIIDFRKYNQQNCYDTVVEKSFCYIRKILDYGGKM